MRELLHSVYDQPVVDPVHAQYDRVIDELSEELPMAADHLDEVRVDLLVFTADPMQATDEWVRSPPPPPRPRSLRLWPEALTDAQSVIYSIHRIQ